MHAGAIPVASYFPLYVGGWFQKASPFNLQVVPFKVVRYTLHTNPYMKWHDVDVMAAAERSVC